MTYAVVFGTDMYIGTSGVLSYEVDGRVKEFFRVREIYKARSTDSYLALDVDIKDLDGTREVKLFKSKPVVESQSVTVHYDKQRTTVIREDGVIVIDVEQLEPTDPSLPQDGPVRKALDSGQLDAIIRITGNFSVGDNKLEATTEGLKFGGNMMGGNLSIGTGGLVLGPMGFSF